METICSTNSSEGFSAFVYSEASGATGNKHIDQASTVLVSSTVGSDIWILGQTA